MLSEIGSNFWISPEEVNGEPNLSTPKKFGCDGSDYVWMSTGRSATRLVLQTILQRNPQMNRIALLPSFTCHTVIEPFLELGFEIHTLPIAFGLITTIEEITQAIVETQATVLLVHRYYGFDTLPGFNSAINDIQRKGAIVVEDCTQCLYSTFENSNADYFVGSIRKWCGVPDGGFAVCREGTFLQKPNKHDKKLESAKREACELKYAYMFKGRDYKLESKQRYREAEHILDTQTDFYTIGKLSSIIQTNLDIEWLSRERRDNYEYLTRGLKKMNGISIIFSSLPQDVVPLYLPIWVEDRDKVQSVFADNAVYAPVVWPKAECCPSVCEYANGLYDHLLCIPIDQRYGRDDMQRVLDILINTNE